MTVPNGRRFRSCCAADPVGRLTLVPDAASQVMRSHERALRSRHWSQTPAPSSAPPRSGGWLRKLSYRLMSSRNFPNVCHLPMAYLTWYLPELSFIIRAISILHVPKCIVCFDPAAL